MKKLIAVILMFSLASLFSPVPAAAQWTVPLAPRPVMSGGSWTHIQSCAGMLTNTGSSSVSCTAGFAIGAGHFLWVCIVNYGGTLGTLTFNDTGTAVIDMAEQYLGEGLTYSRCSYISSASGGETTFTATTSHTGGMNYTALTVDEFSGVGALDLNDTPVISSGTTVASNNITTTANGDLILGYCNTSSGGGATITIGSGFTAGAGGAFPGQNEYKLQSTAGSVNATFTQSNASYQWVAHVVAFKHL
jgi:hypothetical protein